jgi:hypothetical protein
MEESIQMSGEVDDRGADELFALEDFLAEHFTVFTERFSLP